MCGHVVHARYPLHGLPVCEATAGPLGTILLRPGDVPRSLDGGVVVETGIEIAGRDTLIRVRDRGRILVRDGCEIIVDAEGAERDLQPFILGSALGAVFLQNDLLPLHASAVFRGAEAIAFAGHSGAGKSTMAAAMAAAGYAQLTDDLSVVETAIGHAPIIHPGVPTLKLWHDSADAVGLDARNATPELSWAEKLHFMPPLRETPAVKRLAAIYFLEVADTPDAAIEPLSGPHAVAALACEIYRRSWLMQTGKLDARLQDVARLARGAPCFRLRRPHRFDMLPRLVEMLAAHRYALGRMGEGQS